MKKWMIGLIAIVTIIILIFGFMLISKLKNESACRQYYDKSERVYLYEIRCFSLCPTEVIPLNSSRMTFNPSCLFHCRLLSENFSKTMNSPKLDFNKIKCKSDSEINYSESMGCLNLLIQEGSQEYKSCFDNFLGKNKAVLDTSDFQLGIYQNYAFELTEARCTDNSAKFKVKLVEGTPNLDLTITLYDNTTISARNYRNYSAPSVGETKEYSIPYELPIKKASEISVNLFSEEMGIGFPAKATC